MACLDVLNRWEKPIGNYKCCHGSIYYIPQKRGQEQRISSYDALASALRDMLITRRKKKNSQTKHIVMVNF